MNIQILNQIKVKQTYPPQNWDRLKMVWENNLPISFFSWECPPRQIVEDKKNGRWVNFDIDIEAIVKGNKIDSFTEIPRLTSQWKKEKWFIETVVKQNSKASYTKIIADTNGLYLYKKTEKIMGRNKIKSLAQKFRKALIKESVALMGKNTPKIVLYTEMMKNFQSDYKKFFNLVIQNFNNQGFIPSNIRRYWEDRIIKHVGLIDNDRLGKYSLLKRIIASYATEGMIFEILNKSQTFPNPVWINWEEKPESTQTTELLRSKNGIQPLPVVYFVKE